MPGTRISLHAPAAASKPDDLNNIRTPSPHGCRDARCSQISTCSCTGSTCSHDDLNAPWPVHPVESMRGAFQESIQEAMDSDQKIRDTLNAATRRLQLLELGDEEVLSEEYSSRWRQRPNAKFHPLWKLIAQISFGVHLLQQKIAKSDEEVIRILQTHVDDVDGFIEDTNADFDLAVKDIEERHDLLCMPLQHGRVFDRMLKSGTFRGAIMEGNEIIEKIIFRTNRAMTRTLDDVKAGLDAVAALSKFLQRLGNEWTHRDESMQGVYVAMQGNAEGWQCCFKNIQDRGAQLTSLLVTLGATVNDVSRRAGIASRIGVRSAQHSPQTSNLSPVGKSPHGFIAPPTATAAKPRLSRDSLNKPLPPDPLLSAISADALVKSARSTPELSAKSPKSPTLPLASPNPGDSIQSRRPKSKLMSLQTANSDAIRQRRFTEASYHTARTGPSSPQSKVSVKTPRDISSPMTEPIMQEPTCPPLTGSDTTDSVESLSPFRSPDKASVPEPTISRSPLESNPCDYPAAHIPVEPKEKPTGLNSRRVTRAPDRARAVDARKSTKVQKPTGLRQRKSGVDNLKPRAAATPGEDAYNPFTTYDKTQTSKAMTLEEMLQDKIKIGEPQEAEVSPEALPNNTGSRPLQKRRSTAPSNFEFVVPSPHPETIRTRHSISTLGSQCRDSIEVHRPTSFIAALESDAKPAEPTIPPRSMSAQSSRPFGHGKDFSRYLIVPPELSMPSAQAFNSGINSHAASSPVTKSQPKYKLMPEICELSPTATPDIFPARLDSPVDTALPSWADTKGTKSDKRGGGSALGGRRRPSIQAIRDALFKKSGSKGSHNSDRSMPAGGFKSISAMP